MYGKTVSQQDLNIPRLGPARCTSPLAAAAHIFIEDTARIIYPRHVEEIESLPPPGFELAGPRSRLFFDPSAINCGIVTCGGLCPGINNVIRAIVYQSYDGYGVRKVYGFRYGYSGMVKEHGIAPLLLDNEMVNDIHEKGGTILGSSRGPQDVSRMVDYLCELEISILFAIGGDGTLRGAAGIAAEIERRGLPLSVIGIPKTIDNDISFVEKTFGFETAVAESMQVIQSAHIESKGVEYGVGLVKLMGRDSGFIAAQATLANTDVNFCLVPEVPFRLDGEAGLLQLLKNRLLRRRHAVIVVAEGAGQDLIHKERTLDESGNVMHEDIGLFLKGNISSFFDRENLPVTIKYIDPSYIIRSRPATANDSMFCLEMGQNAVHAGMSGRTNMLVGYWNQHYTHVPIGLAISARRKISPHGNLWQSVLSVTEQGRCHP
jgi:6-phosphofructokinase 1